VRNANTRVRVRPCRQEGGLRGKLP
jgi:hypothetical protein